MIKPINTKNAPEAIGPYSQAAVFGNIIFTSGQIGIDPSTNIMVEGGIGEQARQVFENIKAVLESENSGLQSIIKTSVFLKNMSDFSVLNQIYSFYIKEPYPARSTFEVSNLPKDALVEIEVIAYKNL